METESPALSTSVLQDTLPTALPSNNYDTIKKYYDVAGPDYESWSRNFNMHFGYCCSFTDIFSLERMLKNMNEEVIKGLKLHQNEKGHIADLGCGVGTVARHIAKKYPCAYITGITISDYQLEKGRELIDKDHVEQQVKMVKQNFESLDFDNEYFSHAYALESACHANGSGKELFIAEMARVLKPGGTFCIADGFLKHDKKLPRFFNYLYQKIIRYWALPCFGNIQEFEANLKKYGLDDIHVREISYRIAPSVAYVPWTCIKFFVKEIWRNRSLRMKKERWYNVYGPVLGMILGLYRNHFGYYIITGKKA
jgi:ubiquinone/menaquinone biosynthesis C-methylase UbiE